MTFRKTLPLLLVVVVFSRPAVCQEKLDGHPVTLDREGKLLSWLPQEKAYDGVMRRAWDFLLKGVSTESNGLKSYLAYCCLGRKTLRGAAWPHNSAGLYAMMVDSAAGYYAYSGDRRVIGLVKEMLDYQLTNGTTPANWPWGGVPYASSDHGATIYRGAHDFKYDAKRPGRGDGYGVIEPDKVGELGYGYLKFYKLTGEQRYRDAAIACANALARHVRKGAAEASPWPFRIYAETNVVREEYTASIVGPLRLLDELTRLNLGETAAYRNARQTAWEWLIAYPIKNNVWANYFEDVPVIEKPTNHNQINPLEVARYLMERPEMNTEWRERAPALISWVEKHFAVDTEKNERGAQFGANTISEQIHFMYKMGSHTSRYASALARWYELTGDEAAKEKAFRSFNWATYMCREDGAVYVGVYDGDIWFSDGYGDYIRHFLAGMGAAPEWAPPGEDHLLRSTSVIRQVSYGPKEIRYTAFDGDGEEVLRLSFTPVQVIAGRRLLPRAESGAGGPGWSFETSRQALRVRRRGAQEIRIK
jgi:hypothetical protein